MRNIICLCACVFLSFSFVSLSAQSYELKGKIKEKESALEFINVQLLKLSDSSFIKATVTGSSGQFQFRKLQKTGYLLKLSAIGYETRYLKIIISSPETDLGDIFISASRTDLKEIFITRKKPAIRYEGNRLIMNVQNSLIQSIGDAKDVIRMLPGVVVTDNQIEVLERGAPVIFINNRRLRDKNELTQLRSEDITEVELIESPNASYNSDEKSVIIIRTKRNTERGLAFQVSDRLRQGNRFSHFENINTSYQKKGFNSFLSYQHGRQKKISYDKLTTIAYVDTMWTNENSNKYTQNFDSDNLSTGIDYQINKKNAFGLQYGLVKSPVKVNVYSDTKLSADRIDISHLTSNSLIQAPQSQHEFNGFYNGELGTRWTLQADADYVRNTSSNRQEGSEVSDNISRTIDIFSSTSGSIYAAKAKANYSIKSTAEFSFGAEYSRVRISGNSGGENDIISESSYLNKEKRRSGFLQYISHGKSEWSLGLRYENVDYSALDLLNSQEDHKKTFSNLLPSLSFSRKFENTTFNFNYSKRIERPSFSQLNNAVYYNSRFDYQQGNPGLQPQVLHDLNSSLQFKSFRFQINYENIRDYINLYSYSDPDYSSRIISTFSNYKNYQKIVARISYHYSNRFWESETAMGGTQPWFKAVFQDNTLRLDNPYMFFFSNNIFPVSGSMSFYLNVLYASQGNQSTYLIKPTSKIDLGIQKSFLRKNLLISLWGMDIFRKSAGSNSRWTRKLYNISTIKYGNEDNSYVQLSLSYKINDFKKKYRGEDAAEQEKSRL